MASAGYMVVSPNFYDGTATAAKNKENVDVPFSHANGGKYNEPDGSSSAKAMEEIRVRFETHRVPVV